jgi:hypothetical protein
MNTSCPSCVLHSLNHYCMVDNSFWHHVKDCWGEIFNAMA